MNRDMLSFAVIISIFLLVFAWKFFQIAISEHEKTKEWPAMVLTAGVILILLSIVSIWSAVQMN
ncbi:MAG: hypothetical protein WC788_08390 [Candidatus Paceibacterota bacterium]|jgi:hypothetical protein